MICKTYSFDVAGSAGSLRSIAGDIEAALSDGSDVPKKICKQVAFES